MTLILFYKYLTNPNHGPSLMYFMDHQAKERLDVSKADFGPGLEPI